MAEGYNQTAETRTARRQHRCQEYPSFATIIQPGDEYARFVAFPGDVNSSDQPWVLKLCVRCATKYGRPMPPRRSHAKRGASA